MADTKFFFILLMVLAVTSIPTALIVMSYNDWNNNTTTVISSGCPPGAYCPNKEEIGMGVASQLIGNVSLSTHNYLNTSFIDVQTCDNGEWCWIWNNGIGAISRPYHGGLAETSYDYLLLSGINRNSNGYYIVTYQVNNTVKKDFTLVLSSRFSQQGPVLEFTNTEVRVPATVPFTYSYRFSTPGLFNNLWFNISTEYNPDTNKLNWFVNDQWGDININVPDRLLYWNFLETTTYYGGIGARDDGVTLTSYYASSGQNVIGNPEDETFTDKVWEIVPYHDQIESFIGVFADIVNPFDSYGNDINGDPIVPWWMSVMVIIIIIGIAAFGIQILRGN